MYRLSQAEGKTQVIHFKSCPKCRGDMQFQRDQYGEYRQCLQCGFILEQVPGGVMDPNLQEKADLEEEHAS